MLALLIPVAGETVPANGLGLPVLGRLLPRAASEIAASPWSVGGETLDRNFADYDQYRQFVGPLGAKAIRFQAGWAKCEREPGEYSWAWLDHLVDDAISQGVRPWLELGYGNPLYPGGGGAGLGGGLPNRPEALAAWDRWVRASVERYRNRVREWQVWNEPDIAPKEAAPASAYAALFVRTAVIIRELQPAAKVRALGLAGDLDYAEQFLRALREQGRLDLVDAITIHGYPRNPDDTTNIARLRERIAVTGRNIEVWQGETGAPSRRQEHFALSRLPWTENMQAKWNLRRMLAHRALDVPFNLFSMSDMHYRGPDGALRMNYKGLLATNPDQSIARAKPAYGAAQAVFTLFDDSVERVPGFAVRFAAQREPVCHGFRHQPSGAIVAAYWFCDQPPVDANPTTLVDAVFPGIRFGDPVLVDLRTAMVHGLPARRHVRDVGGTGVRGLPVYDSPVILTERSLLRFRPVVP